MKHVQKLLIALLLVPGLALVVTGCGGGANKDAEAFCSCVAKLEAGNEDKQCDEDMEKLEDEFKKDKARYDAFKEAATKKCPQAQELIDRMN